MISVVVVGRNDTHGYNLTKRVSSSLNSIAHFLTEEDEIIFVDWNTPIGYPAMPISIQDDLLEKTKKIMRIVKVSSSTHKKVAGDSRRALIEPVARNVGIRRAKMDSNWVLSTNTDILFSSPSKVNSKELLSRLERNLWLSARFELPEFVWETFDRREPTAIDAKIKEWYLSQRFVKRIRVDEASSGSFLIPDAVGDFQLATRDLWNAVKGFPENMKQGWHVDTRLTIQMAKKCGINPSLIFEQDLIIFHQNHLRNSTVYHESEETNPAEDVHKSYENAETWGLNEEPIEEVHFERNRKLLNILESQTKELTQVQSNSTSEFVRLEEEAKHLSYDITHVINYLADEICLLSKGALVHCFTSNLVLEKLLKEMAIEMEFEITFPKVNELTKDAYHKPLNVNLLILDFGVATTTPLASPHFSKRKSSRAEDAGIIAVSTRLIAETYRITGARVCCVRAQNWAIRTLARTYFALPLFNNFTSILSGTIKPNPKINWIQDTVIVGGVIADYGLSKKSQRLINIEKLSWKAESVGIMLPAFRKYLPARAKKIVKMVFRILNNA